MIEVNCMTTEPTDTTLAPRDEVVIVTMHNIYRFTVENPEDCSGTLDGGVLPERSRGVLCGALDELSAFHPATLRVGARALFLVADEEDGSGFRKIITSPLVNLHIVAAG